MIEFSRALNAFGAAVWTEVRRPLDWLVDWLSGRLSGRG